MIEVRKTCLYCGEEMNSITAKKKFCSDLHRLYYNREKNRQSKDLQLIKDGKFSVISAEVVKLPNGGTEGKFLLGVDAAKQFFDGHITVVRLLKENNGEGELVAEYFSRPADTQDQSSDLWINNMDKSFVLKEAILGSKKTDDKFLNEVFSGKKKASIEELKSIAAGKSIVVKSLNQKKELLPEPPEELTGIEIAIWRQEQKEKLTSK